MALLRAGFTRVRQAGSHVRYRGQISGETRYVTLVANEHELAPRTLQGIRHQLGLSSTEFDSFVARE